MPPINLDLQTLSFIMVFVTVLLTFIVIFVWLTQKSYAGFGLWVISNIAVAAGILLLGIEGVWMDLLGTSLTFGAVLIGYEGNRRFLYLKPDLFFSASIFALHCAGLVYFKFFDNDNQVLQVSFSSFLVGVISFYCGKSFIKTSSEKTVFSFNFTAFTYFIFAFVMISRAIITPLTGDKNDFFRPDGFQPMFFILYILFEIVWTFNYVNLNASRLHDQLKATQMELEKLATTDYLTGIGNQRSFLENGESEIKRAERFRHPLSVIMFDLDFFKRVNDQYGHAAGDRVLTEIVQVCRKILRVTDTFGRLGGEEFAVLLPHTDIDGARTVAEYLRSSIEKAEVAFASEIIKVTASIGVTELGDGDTQIRIILDRADNLLYAAKNNGRNQVVSDTAKHFGKLAAA